MADSSRDAYARASEILSKMTLDLRDAIPVAGDADAREYAFALAHLTRDITKTLVDGVWTSAEESGRAALDLINLRAERHPNLIPDWLRRLTPIVYGDEPKS